MLPAKDAREQCLNRDEDDENDEDDGY